MAVMYASQKALGRTRRTYTEYECSGCQKTVRVEGADDVPFDWYRLNAAQQRYLQPGSFPTNTAEWGEPNHYCSLSCLLRWAGTPQ